MAFYGKFHTNYLQRVRIVDAKVVNAAGTAAEDMYVNQLVEYNKTDGTIKANTTGNIDAIEGSVTCILALSDRNFGPLDPSLSVPYAHTPVESKTLQYNGAIKGSATAKKVAIWKVVDPMDVVVYQSNVIEQLN